MTRIFLVKRLPGLTRYAPSQRLQHYLQETLFHERGIDEGRNILLLLEHAPVYTAGRRYASASANESASLNEIQMETIKSLGADYHTSLRGGKLTFHGPGQLIGYPICNVKSLRRPSVKCYVNDLEEVLIGVCRDLGLQRAQRTADTGVWIGDSKVAAIGVHVSRYVTAHGFGLNCNTDLNWFKHIVPCGLRDKTVTSLSQQLGRDITIDSIIPLISRHFERVFDCRLVEMEKEDECLSQHIDKFLNSD